MILRRLSVLMLTLLALGACDVTSEEAARGFLADFAAPGSAGGRDALSEPAAGPPPVGRVALAGGAVVVAGPRGYCIDPVTIESAEDGGFAVLASCSILSGGASGPSVAPALVTVTVGGPQPAPVLPDAATIARAAGVPLATDATRGPLVLAQMARGGDTALEGGDARHWRGAFLMGRRLVALALYAPSGSAMAGRDGARLLQGVHEAIVRASPDIPAPMSGRSASPSRG
ncbi:hypothetical protein [Roseivivax isoporae]|uniref:Dihydroxy-acid dehydratase n=1 Tax=Roseivivax isoporae LMG 25204 TaxID=1449351 RepID=X7F4N3_9RHOB|nr:hypothetical protein [Roseivivax isoporae]ETX27887.1 hypothetical protein RISW2_10485 [Roseivivax isoporae LMG 25204]